MPYNRAESSYTMPFPFRLAAVDLDDTLLGPDKVISPANYAAIRRLVDAGVIVILASGRRHENMRGFYRQLELTAGWMVSCNGALTKNDATGVSLQERLLPQRFVGEILREGERLGVTQNFYHRDGPLYVNATNEWTAMYQARTKSELWQKDDILSLIEDPALKIIWVMSAPNAVELSAYLRDRYGADCFDIVITDPEYLEFMAPGVNKATGLALVSEHFGIPASECVAFGDGNNDVEMLSWAGLGVAMPHARSGALEAADRVAPEGDPETAFARAVDQLFAAA